MLLTAAATTALVPSATQAAPTPATSAPAIANQVARTVAGTTVGAATPVSPAPAAHEPPVSAGHTPATAAPALAAAGSATAPTAASTPRLAAPPATPVAVTPTTLGAATSASPVAATSATFVAPAPRAPAPAAPGRKHAAATSSAVDSPVVFDRAQLEVHASGRISTIFGEEFQGQDDYARQVRMPEPPLLLADRVTSIDAVPGSMGKGSLVTETDFGADAWYLNDGYMPAGVMIESGQADLLLISYLGVDALNAGDRVYRLLGCELTYHGGLPHPGETLRYDIHVDGHANHGDVRLFFFHYDCAGDGQPRLTVRNGQAGFFTDQELAESAGILWRPEDQEIVAQPKLSPPEIECRHSSFDRDAVRAFSEGRGWQCFGEGFDRLQTHVRTPKIQSGRMCFIDEVTELDPRGGAWGRGYVKAETPIHPDNWFFDGHFKNDPCMPGTLMFEGCLQVMAFHLASMGYTVDRDGWRFEPVPDEPVALRCRGQVTPESKNLTYEIFVEEVIDGPIPTIYADLLCTVDGLQAFHARRMGLRLVPDWPLTSQPELLESYVEPKPVATADGFTFDYASLLACAWGKPSDAFGEMYRVFDGTRRVARLPGPPYHFMSRVTKVAGSPDRGGHGLGVCEPGATIEIEYDIPPDAWYFNENGAPTMPFCVLLEAALQPCGWLASYVGSALTVDRDLSFRNLDGTGTLLDELLVDAGTLRTVVTITSVSASAGMIIEAFDVECFIGDRKVYVMDTVFGFFPGEALAEQVGLPTSDAQRALLEAPNEHRIDLTTRPADLCEGSPRLPNPMLLMLDRVTGFWPEGGAHGLGALRAEKDVDPGEWFFKAHFFQDPVQPGSLGIEAMIQLLQVFMLKSDMHAGIERAKFEPIALDAPLKWKYRGQVVPGSDVIRTTIEIVETGSDERGPYAFADASLWVDGKRIYQAERLGLRIVSEAPKDKLDPDVDTWVKDHCPTWTVPALPMMSIVDHLAAAVDGPVTGLSDVRVKRWVVLDQPRRLETRRRGDRVVLDCDGEEVASGVVTTGEYREPPEAWPTLDGPMAESPYDTGALFHGPAFHVLKQLVRSGDDSSAILAARSPDSSAPEGVLNPILLDGATHAIEHERGDKVAYPAIISELEVFEATPRDGDVRCEVRADGHLGGPDYPAYRLQLIADDRVWLTARIIEASFPKGRLGSVPALDRRSFLRDRRWVDGVSLSRGDGAERRLTAAEVEQTNWLPGTVEALYGTTDVEAIAIAESAATQVGLHPGRIATSLPLTEISPQVRRDEGDIVAAAELGLDVAPVREYWTKWFDHEPWPVEDLYYGLIERFVGRIVLDDAPAFEAIRGRSALFLANHQTGVESLLFSIIASGLTEVPTVTLAKAEHRETWLGRLIAHAFAYPGIVDPQVIAFFDREDKDSLPGIIGDLAKQMAGPGRSVMVHVEGTRSFDCATPVQKMSGAFIDMALAVGAPIVPVRFVGGLPRTPVPTRIEFPIGMGRQDIWFGQPLLPEVLAPMHYGARKEAVVAAINRLGPSNEVEGPLPGDPAFAARVQQWVDARGVDGEHAVLHQILRDAAEPCAETRALLDAVDAGLVVDTPWLAELQRRLAPSRA